MAPEESEPEALSEAALESWWIGSAATLWAFSALSALLDLVGWFSGALQSIAHLPWALPLFWARDC